MSNKKCKELAKAAILVLVLLAATHAASAADIQLSKETIPSDAVYKIGDTVNYTMTVTNPSEDYSFTLDVFDDLPNATTVLLENDLTLLPGESKTYYISYVVNAADITDGNHIWNTLRVEGYNNATPAEYIYSSVGKTSEVLMPEPPTFDFTWSQECNLTVRFVGVGIDPDGSIVNHTWDFGDGPTITDSGAPGAMLHQFPAEGTYTVTLSGCDNDGLCTSVSKEVRVVFEPCENCTLRLYGTFDMGAGDLGFKDPETGLKPENPPYTDPVAPFYPQSGQAPKKDFITFNPAIMDHNQGYPELSFRQCESFVQDGNDVQQPKEKVFKRMWYEKLWFKDEDKDGCWDIVMVRDSYTKKVEVCGPEDFEDVHEMFTLGYTIKEHNNDPALGDIYGPAIVQEFTYMFLDTNTMPIMIQDGSRVLIPMASWTAGDGIDSFDADGDNKRDALYVESERTVGIDIDQDGRRKESMDRDRKELSGDETLVLVLKNKLLGQGAKVQMFDHVVELVEVLGDQAIFNVYDNEGGGTQRSTMNVAIGVGEYKRFYRALEDTSGTTFYLKLIATDSEKTKAIVEMGRMFGQAGANIGANIDWNQKAFMVDGVLYEIAGIKAKDNCVKYIVIREKLPKDEIKLYGKHLEVWEPNTVLPEMPPFNEEHEIFVDVQPTWTKPESQQDKIGEKVARPPLEIKYVKEDVEERYKGELKEIYDEMKIRECSNPHPTNDEWCKEKERWLIEWFYTYPDQYTEFVLPRGELYLVTLSWYAPEASYHIWDGEEEDDGPIAPIAHGFVNRVKFWYGDCTGPLYINESGIRIFGTFDMGAGDLGFKDPETGLKPENPPYTDPVAPFYPQSGQAPKKDFITFNPAIMDHNQGYPELSFRQCDDNDVQQPKEKVFKRMWYEKLWFKDEDKDGCWDIVMVRDSYTKKVEVCGPEDFEDVHEMFTLGYTIKEHNNDPALGDIYGPAIVQEFTYMFLDTNTMPIMIQDGSRVLIPMASWTAGDGIDSFDADGDNKRDALYVESERTVGIDIDQDGRRKESMDRDRKELSGDETLVLVLKNKLLGQGAKVQMFDHVVELVEVLGDQAIFNVYDNEGGGTQRSTMNVAIGVGEYKRFYRALEDTSGTTFYLKLIATDSEKTKAIVEMGRMFGQAGANIGANIDWNQKAFMVDGVLYEIAGIKAKDNCVKYIVIREKLPKDEIKLYGKHLEVWEPNTVLPEMPPFNEEHEIFVDVQPTWTKPESQQDKIGEKVARPPLEIKYVKEDVEERYKGELKEIYDEMKIRECSNPHPTNDEWCKEKERWLIEWFYTYPDQYTEFVLPRGELYLVTLSWYAPEASYHIWDGEEEDDGPIAPIAHGFVNRVKFWYDPSDPTDIYVNRIEGGNSTPSNPYNPHEPYNPYDANKNYEIEMDELLNAVADWNKGDLSMSGLMELVNYWYAGQKYCVYCI